MSRDGQGQHSTWCRDHYADGVCGAMTQVPGGDVILYGPPDEAPTVALSLDRDEFTVAEAREISEAVKSLLEWLAASAPIAAARRP